MRRIRRIGSGTAIILFLILQFRPAPAQVSPARVPDQAAVVALDPAAVPVALTGDQLFHKAKENVFKLVFREKGARSGAGHGTAFAVRKNGFLITNLHVVAEAVENPNKYEMILEKNGESLEAKVITIDAVNDLALVKVESVFPSPLEIKMSGPSVAGEAAYSFGFPQSEGFSMAQGNLNGERMMGFGEVLSGTMPINPGMSGGPCLNVFGQVVGVNRAIQLNAQNISYFSPWGALRTVADHASQFHPIKNEEWRSYAVDQIERQEKKMLSIATAENKSGVDSSQKFGHLQFHAPFDADCGQSSAGSEGQSKSSIFICRGVSLSLLGGERTALNVTTYASSAGSGWLDHFAEMASGAVVENRYEQVKNLNYPNASRMPTSIDKNEICSSKNLRNGNGLLLTLRYCSLALHKFSGLYTTAVRIEHANQRGERVSFGQLFEGMTMPATLKLTDYFIESLEETSK